jgi:hypothetical protein
VNVSTATGGQGVDNTVRFEAAGRQVNTNFGKATSARNARIIQGRCGSASDLGRGQRTST